MRFSLRQLAATLLVLLAVSVRAQEKPLLRPSTDAELWISGAVELRFDEKAKKKIKKAKDDKLTGEALEKAEQKAAKAKRSFNNRFRLSGELGYRGNENLTSSKLTYTVVGFNYRLLKFLRVGAEHRYNFRDKFTSNSHRVDVNARVAGEWGRFSGDYRAIVQHEFIPPIRYRTILRNRFALEYNIPKWRFDPQVTMETFTALHHTGNRLIGLRYGMGTTFALDEKKKRHVIDVSLRHDREQNMPGLKYRWIWALAYEYRWGK